MMTRITATFLTLLLVATLAMGTTWRQIEGLTAGRMTTWDMLLIGASGIAMILALLALGRILYRTSQIFSPNFIEMEKEKIDV